MPMLFIPKIDCQLCDKLSNDTTYQNVDKLTWFGANKQVIVLQTMLNFQSIFVLELSEIGAIQSVLLVILGKVSTCMLKEFLLFFRAEAEL